MKPETKRSPRRACSFGEILLAFGGALLLFGLINVLAVQLRSDCGLPAAIGIDACSDDIVRLGWPLQFFEQGGIGYHTYFDSATLAADIVIGVVGALLVALAIGQFRKHKQK